MSEPEIVPFVHEGLGNSSYLLRVGDGSAALVDPDRTVQRYLDEAKIRGWEIVAVFETHLHADFVSGGLETRSVTGATIQLPVEAGAGFPHRGVVAGERIDVGDVEFEAVASPGHTPEHLSYVVRGDDAAPPLLLRGCAREARLHARRGTRQQSAPRLRRRRAIPPRVAEDVPRRAGLLLAHARSEQSGPAAPGGRPASEAALARGVPSRAGGGRARRGRALSGGVRAGARVRLPR